MEFKSFNVSKIKLTKYLFFTGKGGVGKTSAACATAVALADAGKKIMLISTDPASNLQDVFNTELNNKDQLIKVKSFREKLEKFMKAPDIRKGHNNKTTRQK